MLKTKQFLLFAFAAFAASLANAAPVAVIETGTALSQPAPHAATTLVETAPVTVLDPNEHQVQVTQQAAAQTTAGAESELSNWSMLLVGAGVLLLPRKRRLDNSVR